MTKIKEPFRRGEEGFFLFRGLVRSQGPKRIVVTEASDRSAGRGATKPDESRRNYFLLDFLVVDFFEPLELDFLELLFFAMALVTSFRTREFTSCKNKGQRFFAGASVFS